MAALRVFIIDKYVHRKYANREYREPPTIENYAAHPFLAEYLTGEGNGALATTVAGATAAVGPPAASAPRSSAPAPVPHFDLLSLDDHHMPTSVPVAPLTTAIEVTTSAPAPLAPQAQSPAPPAATWDPFAPFVSSHPLAASSSISNSSTNNTQSSSAAVPALIDPFSERSTSRSSTTSSFLGDANNIFNTTGQSGLNKNSLNSSKELIGANANGAPAAIFDPFALASSAPMNTSTQTTSILPPQQQAYPLPSAFPMTAAPTNHTATPVPTIISNSAAIGPQMTNLSSSSAPMRAPSGSVQSKGSMTHDDILAMFDRPPSQRSMSGAQNSDSFNAGAAGF